MENNNLSQSSQFSDSGLSNEEIDILTATKLVEVIYLDHVLFRNLKIDNTKPSLRKTIGWITKQDEEAIWLTWDKPIESQHHESEDTYSGLVILRDTIQELIELK